MGDPNPADPPIGDEMKNNSHFQIGSGCYTCEDCGNETRETGEGESFVNLCRRCLEAGYAINAHADGEMNDEQLSFRLAELAYGS